MKGITIAGSVSNIFSTTGTVLKGVLWGLTAVPEIKMQADKSAVFLLFDEGGRR